MMWLNEARKEGGGGVRAVIDKQIPVSLFATTRNIVLSIQKGGQYSDTIGKHKRISIS